VSVLSRALAICDQSRHSEHAGKKSTKEGRSKRVTLPRAAGLWARIANALPNNWFAGWVWCRFSISISFSLVSLGFSFFSCSLCFFSCSLCFFSFIFCFFGLIFCFLPLLFPLFDNFLKVNDFLILSVAICLHNWIRFRLNFTCWFIRFILVFS